MDAELKAQYKDYYRQMFLALRNGDRGTAHFFRTLMENLRQKKIFSRQLPAFDPIQFPQFVRATLNKSQREVCLEHSSNCINAAFNFHSEYPVYSPYTTMDFLKTIRTDFKQLNFIDELQFGDLVVFWSRTGDEWKDKKISVEALNPISPGFPFGLVFDHVAVFIGSNCLFHKPDPTLDSQYQINHWDDVIGFSEVVDGFELTFHRKNV
jgi:hypothetical protein